MLSLSVSCGQRNKGETIKDIYSYEILVGKTVSLSTDEMICVFRGDSIPTQLGAKYYFSKPYLFVLYLGAEWCNFCNLELFYQWDSMIDYLGRDRIGYCFIVKPRDDSELSVLIDALNDNYFSMPVFFDTQNSFYLNNRDLLSLSGPHIGFFIDSSSRILLSGNPFEESAIVNEIKRYLTLYK